VKTTEDILHGLQQGDVGGSQMPSRRQELQLELDVPPIGAESI
jgi:hypothetical protein